MQKQKLKPLGYTQVLSIYFIFTLHKTTLVSRFIAKTVVKPRKNQLNQVKRKKSRFIDKTIYGFK